MDKSSHFWKRTSQRSAQDPCLGINEINVTGENWFSVRLGSIEITLVQIWPKINVHQETHNALISDKRNHSNGEFIPPRTIDQIEISQLEILANRRQYWAFPKITIRPEIRKLVYVDYWDTSLLEIHPIDVVPQIYFHRYISVNIFPWIYFHRYISLDIFPHIYFHVHIPCIYFQRVNFHRYIVKVYFHTYISMNIFS